MTWVFPFSPRCHLRLFFLLLFPSSSPSTSPARLSGGCQMGNFSHRASILLVTSSTTLIVLIVRVFVCLSQSAPVVCVPYCLALHDVSFCFLFCLCDCCVDVLILLPLIIYYCDCCSRVCFHELSVVHFVWFVIVLFFLLYIVFSRLLSLLSHFLVLCFLSPFSSYLLIFLVW